MKSKKSILKIKLPPKPSEMGAVCRLLLHEALGPEQDGYEEARVLKSMQWMKVVLANRLYNNPGQFDAKGAENLKDIIRAHHGRGKHYSEQFQSFGHYPNLNTKVIQRLQLLLDVANADPAQDRRAPRYREFVQNALFAANAPLIQDPCKTGSYGFKKADSEPPGGRFIKYTTFAGIDFYTLTDNKS